MRSVVINNDRTLEIVDLDPEPVRSHDVRVSVSYCGICGSDLHYLEMPELGPPGTVMGHELTGVVTERGTDVDGLEVGDYVAVLPFEYCGNCPPCRRDLMHLCTRWRETRLGGRHRRGGFAESVVVPESSSFRLPHGLSDKHGALGEPLAVAVHALSVAGPTADAPIVVLGGGPIGLLTSLVLLARGHTRFLTVEPNEQRRSRLDGFGVATMSPDRAVESVSSRFGSKEPLTVLDCTGHPSGIALALEMLTARGQLVLVGYSVEPVPLDTFRVVREEICIRGAVTYSHADFAHALELLATGSLPAEELITAVRSITEAQSTFDDLRSGSSEHLKVLLTPHP